MLEIDPRCICIATSLLRPKACLGEVWQPTNDIWFLGELKNTEVATYPMNLAPDGPITSTRLARASPSISGGGWGSLLSRTSLQVIRVGCVSRSGGMMRRIPEWRHPRIAPPRASTRKLTRNLHYHNHHHLKHHHHDHYHHYQISPPLK